MPEACLSDAPPGRRADVRHVRQILGHRSLETTAVYTRVDVTDLRKVLARTHARERMLHRAGRPGLAVKAI